MSKREKVITDNKFFKETDRGLNRIIKDYLGLGQSFVKVGVQGSEATKKDKESKTTNIDKAVHNEFGTDIIPPRPFLRRGVETNINKINSIKLKLVNQVIDDRISVDHGLNELGLKTQSLIQAGFTKIKWQKNAASTIRQKGSSQPLIDTGFLRQSITYVVVRTSAIFKGL